MAFEDHGGVLGFHTRDNARHGEVRPARAGVREAAIEHVEGFKPTPLPQRMAWRRKEMMQK